MIDQDARSVVLYRNIVNVGYCLQVGCDAKYKLFVNNDTGTVNDTHALSPMALDAKELLGVKTMNTITDILIMAKSRILQVQKADIKVISKNNSDFISLTDMTSSFKEM